jgi:hypothetical protein
MVISAMLDVSAEKIQCVLDGDKHCTYVVTKNDPVTAQPAESEKSL